MSERVQGEAGRTAAAVASRADLPIDEESTRFFGRAAPNEVMAATGELDTTMLDQYDEFDQQYDPQYDQRYDAQTDIDPFADYDQEPTPALLAAKAEPLAAGAAAPRGAGRSVSKQPRSKASEAARTSKARAETRRKPKEPNKLWMALAVVAILLAGFATAYFFTQRGNDDVAADGADTAADGTDPATDTTAVDGTAETDTSAPAETQPAQPTGPPAVAFNEAAVGPINSGVEYTLAVSNGPPNANYQLLVDGTPQADPVPELPPVIFTPGRHLLVVNILTPEGDTATDPVLVYALTDQPAPTWRANLSSVPIDDLETGGWAEAVRQFDEYVAAGHTDLQLMPSDLFPDLTPGFWNLYVGGFGDNGAATAYCESYGLAVPDQCFPKYADPNASAG